MADNTNHSADYRHINNREFVEAWMKLDTVTELADYFGRSKGWAYSRAGKLRAKGVMLPTMPQVDEVTELNQLIEQLRKR